MIGFYGRDVYWVEQSNGSLNARLMILRCTEQAPEEITSAIDLSFVYPSVTEGVQPYSHVFTLHDRTLFFMENRSVRAVSLEGVLGSDGTRAYEPPTTIYSISHPEGALMSIAAFSGFLYLTALDDVGQFSDIAEERPRVIHPYVIRLQAAVTPQEQGEDWAALPPLSSTSALVRFIGDDSVFVQADTVDGSFRFQLSDGALAGSGQTPNTVEPLRHVYATGNPACRIYGADLYDAQFPTIMAENIVSRDVLTLVRTDDDRLCVAFTGVNANGVLYFTQFKVEGCADGTMSCPRAGVYHTRAYLALDPNTNGMKNVALPSEGLTSMSPVIAGDSSYLFAVENVSEDAALGLFTQRLVWLPSPTGIVPAVPPVGDGSDTFVTLPPGDEGCYPGISAPDQCGGPRPSCGGAATCGNCASACCPSAGQFEACGHCYGSLEDAECAAERMGCRIRDCY